MEDSKKQKNKARFYLYFSGLCFVLSALVLLLIPGSFVKEENFNRFLMSVSPFILGLVFLVIAISLNYKRNS